ncbi:hypothetical protein ACIA5G_39065 [Amycolatopsis sp. NPDC051758]|uniref:hypothetical protein n=1 Tax=Amycolatopsis sp. NPDC051758 TaxID=3363935 RepID=UPI003797B40A
MHATLPGNSGAARRSAVAAPTAPAAIRLWPQPCPMPGSVVLGQVSDYRGRVAGVGAERGLQAAVGLGHGEVVVEERRQPPDGVVFLHS